MTAVTLRPLGDATYAVVRGGVDTGALVWGTYAGWDVRRRLVDADAEPWRQFRRMSQAREYLDSPGGQFWLDSLAAEVPR